MSTTGTFAKERIAALPTKLDKFSPPIQKVQPATSSTAKPNENNNKTSRGKGQHHRTNCSFTLRSESLEGFQVLNGNIIQYQQSRQTLEQQQKQRNDDLVICDEQKCTSSSRHNNSSSSSSSSQPTFLVASVEGQCDNKDKRIGQDYLEVNFFAHKGGHVHLLCPDVNYVVDAVCTTFDLVTGVAKLEQGLEEMSRQGPLLELGFAEDTFASCSIVCEDQPLLHSSR